jgi:ABC-2 type transport system ATP-binding protein
MDKTVIYVRDLVKKYDAVTAVDGVSFTVERGEVFSLLGPNGAGKTTTLEIIECIRSLTSGDVRVLGYDVRDPGEVSKVRRLIGVMPQEFDALERLTVEENVKLIRDIYGGGEDLREVLEELGLWQYRRKLYAKLSGGLKRRVGIAMAMISNPELVFLDEPTTGLDVYSRRETWKYIQSLKRAGKTTILTTHYLEEAESLSDRVAIMVKGRIVALDNVSDLINKFGGGVRLRVSGGDTGLESFLTQRGLQWSRADGDEIQLSGLDHKTAVDLVNILYDSGFMVKYEIRSAGLEEVFLKLTGATLTGKGDLA